MKIPSPTLAYKAKILLVDAYPHPKGAASTGPKTPTNKKEKNPPTPPGVKGSFSIIF